MRFAGAVSADRKMQVLEAKGARIPLCGMISEYNTAMQHGPNLRPLLVSRAMIRGFIVSDHMDRAVVR